MKEGGGGSLSVEVTGLVDEASCRRRETLLMVRGFGPDGVLPEGRVSKICVWDRRGRQLSYLHVKETLMRAAPGGMADCSRSPSQQSK